MITVRADWHIKPLPNQYALLPLEGIITLDDYLKIKQGYVPQNKTDKWFFFFEENTLFVHRAITGSCIFQLPMTLNSDYVMADRLIVNRDPAQYRTLTDKYDLALFAWLIDYYLLKRLTPFPWPPRLTKKHHATYQQHMIGKIDIPDMNEGALILLDAIELSKQPTE